MKNIVNLKEFRENVASYAKKVDKGEFFIVMKRSKPIFKVSRVDDRAWEEMINFTKLKKGGVDIDELLSRL